MEGCLHISFRIENTETEPHCAFGVGAKDFVGVRCAVETASGQNAEFLLQLVKQIQGIARLAVQLIDKSSENTATRRSGSVGPISRTDSIEESPCRNCRDSARSCRRICSMVVSSSHASAASQP